MRFSLVNPQCPGCPCTFASSADLRSILVETTPDGNLSEIICSALRTRRAARLYFFWFFLKGIRCRRFASPVPEISFGPAQRPREAAARALRRREDRRGRYSVRPQRRRRARIATVTTRRSRLASSSTRRCASRTRALVPLAQGGERRYHTSMSAQLKHKVPGSDAMVSITAHVPEDAVSAGLLGTERIGHGARIRDDGLIATIGYVVQEAEHVWIGTRSTVVPGFVIGYDFDSGFALVKPTLPLHGRSIELGSAASLRVGDAVAVMSSGGNTQVIEARIVAKQEFAGRWEYVLDQAVFTAPPHDSWSGAALVDSEGRLCGLGSLVISGFEVNGASTMVNMFVPIDLLVPIVDEMCAHGRRLTPPRPWLGMLIHDDQQDLTVVGVYRNCPADKAGLRPGDIIVGIDDEPVVGLANMFRRVWSLGSAGVDVSLNVLRNTEKMQLKVHSGDRAGFQRKGTLQ